MFDRYLIVPGSARAVERDGRVVGFAFEARCAYYRRLILSMVEDLAVSVDGRDYPRDAVRFELDGRSFTLDEMETEYTLDWGFGEPATITVSTDEPLAPGEHELELKERLRISYMPRPEFAEGRAVITL